MLTADTIKFTVTTQRNSLHDTLIHNDVIADFPTSEATISAIVARIETKTRYLSCLGRTVKGVTVTDAKDMAREIRGMISALECVCLSVTLQTALLVALAAARTEALDRLRK